MATSLDEVLALHETYRAALLETCRELGLEPSESRVPQVAFARVLVASLIGGTPLPQTRNERYHVLGQDGSRIAVYATDDLTHAMSGWVLTHSSSRASTQWRS